jgi:hypothetical protein
MITISAVVGNVIVHLKKFSLANILSIEKSVNVKTRVGCASQLWIAARALDSTPSASLRAIGFRKCFEIQCGAAFPSRQCGLESPRHKFQNTLLAGCWSGRTTA